MDISDLPRLTRRNMSDEVYEALKERIISRQFVPGQRLRLVEIERQMGVSRTPVKDALNRLAMQGLVEIRPRKGSFVTDLAPAKIAESFDVRRVLEVYAVELAAQRVTESQLQQLRDIVKELRRLTSVEDWDQIYLEYVALDHELHRLIMEFAANKRLEEIWEQVNVHVQMARARYPRAERELNLAQEEHEQILKAFEAKDIAALQRTMGHHIERAKQSLLRDLEGSKTQVDLSA
jgi:DNA-binding GntR family transcriptional regulator